MENRNGLVVKTRLTEADGRAERRAVLAAVDEILSFKRVTLGAEKGYDAKEFVRELRDDQVTSHAAQKPVSAIDGRTSRHAGYLLSQWRRKGVGEVFGWLNRGRTAKNRSSRALASWLDFTLGAAAYNLVRIRNLTAVGT